MATSSGTFNQRLVTWARIKSPWVTIFNSGACNACDIEIIACLMPRFDIERFGILAKGSPRHADILIITGNITLKQASRLRRVWEQIPEPKYVIAMGACGASAGVFHGLYHMMASVERVVPVDIYVAGCPPRPDEIINAVVACLNLIKEDALHGGKEWRRKKGRELPKIDNNEGEVTR
ncbi:MAG TPA: NADH-quinone oxidoreductase subunit NuoB [Methanoregulaceae archaeon]|nr:NADH-quinone oxidoreductase subunit NuoB [Methanoregulaceae archaeon]